MVAGGAFSLHLRVCVAVVDKDAKWEGECRESF